MLLVLLLLLDDRAEEAERAFEEEKDDMLVIFEAGKVYELDADECTKDDDNEVLVVALRELDTKLVFGEDGTAEELKEFPELA